MRGKVVRLVADKHFGFIKSDASGIDYFFHSSGFDGYWPDLVFDFENKKEIKVEFNDVANNKGPRAENVKRLDGEVK